MLLVTVYSFSKSSTAVLCVKCGFKKKTELKRRACTRTPSHGCADGKQADFLFSMAPARLSCVRRCVASQRSRSLQAAFPLFDSLADTPAFWNASSAALRGAIFTVNRFFCTVLSVEGRVWRFFNFWWSWMLGLVWAMACGNRILSFQLFFFFPVNLKFISFRWTWIFDFAETVSATLLRSIKGS